MSVMTPASKPSFRNFVPPGPVASAFLADRISETRLLRGPVGGGKTVTCIFDGLGNASHMPVCKDGWIHFRLAVVGNTYGQLERNLYPTWKYWLPENGGGWTKAFWEGGGGRSAKHTIIWKIVRDGVVIPVRFEAIFGAIGELSLEQFVRGFEPTAWYLYECDQLPEGIIEEAAGRLNRYPNADMLGDQPFRSYVVGDLNSPDIDSWYYRLVEEVKPAGLKQYVQPSGLSPRAENMANLKPPGRYYLDRFEKNKHRKRWVKRFILNEYGPSEAGEAVYAQEYSDEIHYSTEPIPYDPSRPIYLGFDQGLTNPALVVLQRAASGQWRVIAELVPGRMMARRFAERVRMLLSEVCPKATIAGAWADPAGSHGVDRQGGEVAWTDIVAEELDMIIEPAPYVELAPRLGAVRDELVRLVEGGQPGLVISSACPMLRKGAASHYMFEKRPPEKSQAAQPIKNVWSNPHDALQYVLCGAAGRYGVIAGPRGAGHMGHRPPAGNTVVKSKFLSRW
jgi:hypothetical protein